MRATVETVRGAVYYALFYATLALAGAAAFLPALLSPDAARWAARRFFALDAALLRAICGLRVELRGRRPEGAAVVAAQHQSMLDVSALYRALPRPRFVMKRELTRAPVFGWFALRVGTVPVDRGGGSPAMREMVARMLDATGHGPGAFGELVIFPQGTRVAPGAARPYKAGVHALYAASGLPCWPVAVNTGFFQPKGVRVRPGTAVVEFLAPIPPGLDRAPFMARLEAEIEAASARLAAEAARARATGTRGGG